MISEINQGCHPAPPDNIPECRTSRCHECTYKCFILFASQEAGGRCRVTGLVRWKPSGSLMFSETYFRNGSN